MSKFLTAVDSAQRRLARSWAKLIDHPRLRPLWCVVYLVTIYGGLQAIFNPPVSITSYDGGFAALCIGLLMTLGGIIAGGAVWSRWWKLERLGIGFAVAGVGIYTAVIIGIDMGSAEGTRQLQISVFAIAALLYFIRWAGIKGWDYEPRREE